MAAATLTFEDIDQHIRSADLAAFQPGGKHFVTPEQVTTNPSAALTAVCPAYRLIRPILNAVATLPLIPGNWKGVVKAFAGVMDVVCPAASKG